MLKKLLRYDLKSVFKYWWLGALTTFVLSFVGAGCVAINESPKDLPDSAYALATIGIILVILSFSAFVVMTTLLVYIRYYRHLFSDEGYLTFTLPVKRNDILTSKLVTGFVATISTVLVTLINGIIFLSPFFKEALFYIGWEKDFQNTVQAIISKVGIFNMTIEILELFIIFILSIILVTLFTYLCITVGSIVSKKAKLATAIGIYYAASSAMTVFIYLFFFFGVDSLSIWIDKLPSPEQIGLYPVIFLLVILFEIILCTALYTLTTWLIDRKLNLN